MIDLDDAARRERQQEVLLREALGVTHGGPHSPQEHPDPHHDAMRRASCRPLTPGLLLSDLLGPVGLTLLREFIREEVQRAMAEPWEAVE